MDCSSLINRPRSLSPGQKRSLHEVSGIGITYRAGAVAPHWWTESPSEFKVRVAVATELDCVHAPRPENNRLTRGTRWPRTIPALFAESPRPNGGRNCSPTATRPTETKGSRQPLSPQNPKLPSIGTNRPLSRRVGKVVLDIDHDQRRVVVVGDIDIHVRMVRRNLDPVGADPL